MPLIFFNDTATTEIYTLSLHDALPISDVRSPSAGLVPAATLLRLSPPTRPGQRHAEGRHPHPRGPREAAGRARRSEEHTSELQSRQYLVCRLLLEQKK